MGGLNLLGVHREINVKCEPDGILHVAEAIGEQTNDAHGLGPEGGQLSRLSSITWPATVSNTMRTKKVRLARIVKGESRILNHCLPYFSRLVQEAGVTGPEGYHGWNDEHWLSPIPR